jgi:UDP:flavonoid glycosyltransferase YjiC (YdhE family)
VTTRRPGVLVATWGAGGNLPPLLSVCDAIAGPGAVQALLTLGPAVDTLAVEVPANVTTAAFADHDEVLPGCGALIGHGGLGTTLRASAHGVPQLLLPLGRDQYHNAERIAALGAGLTLAAGATPAGIRAALERLPNEDRFRAAARRAAARIAGDHPDRAATRALEPLCKRRRWLGATAKPGSATRR